MSSLSPEDIVSSLASLEAVLAVTHNDAHGVAIVRAASARIAELEQSLARTEAHWRQELEAYKSTSVETASSQVQKLRTGISTAIEMLSDEVDVYDDDSGNPPHELEFIRHLSAHLNGVLIDTFDLDAHEKASPPPEESLEARIQRFPQRGWRIEISVRFQNPKEICPITFVAYHLKDYTTGDCPEFEALNLGGAVDWLEEQFRQSPQSSNRCVCGRSENFHPWRFCNEFRAVPEPSGDQS